MRPSPHPIMQISPPARQGLALSARSLSPAALARRLGSFLGRDPVVWLVVILSLLAALPLAGPGYFFNAHDALHSVFYLTEFDAALRDGVWYPAWGTDHALGYGYPTFTLYSPLAYYAAEGFHLLGASKVGAVKWTWALATLGAGLAMYGYGRRVLGRAAGLLAAVVYVYMPYHLLDMYVRAALAEYVAFVWLPLALLAFHLLAEQVTVRRVALAGLVYGALWMTHNVTAMAFTPLLAAYTLFRLMAWPRSTWLKGGISRALAALAAALLGLGVAAALLLPSGLERSLVNQEQWVQETYNYARHFVYPSQLFSAAWGYRPDGPGPNDDMSFQLGVVPVVLAMGAVILSLRRQAPGRGLALFLAAATLVAVLLMLPLAAPVWELLPLITLIQFPWRLLALTSVTLAVLAGLAIQQAPSREPADYVPCAVCLLLAVLASWPYTLPEHTPVPASAEGPQMVIEFETKYPDMIGMTAWTKEPPLTSPLVDQYRAGGPLVTAEALAAGAQVEMIRAGGASDELWVRSAAGTPLRFYTYYYPGWRVTIDGQRLPDAALRPEGPYGLLTVDVPPGEHHVLLRWGDTPARAAGKAITVACLLLAVGLMVWQRPRAWKKSEKS